MRIVGTLLATLLALALPACGSEDSSTDEPSGPTEVELADERIAAGRDDCSSWISPLQAELTELTSRLTVGLVFQDYVTAVGDVRVAYDSLDLENLPDAYCLAVVATPLESAMNTHAAAASAWNECVTNYRCDYEGDVQPGLQQQWAETVNLIAQSETALDNYEDPDVYVPPSPPPA